jgi:hypothetical protein
MSPILKRDIGEHVRHTRRLAAAVTGQPADNQKDTSGEEEWLKPPGIYASGSSPRQGMGVIEDEEHRRHTDEWKRTGIALDRKGKGRAREGVNGVGFEGDESDEDGEGEGEGEGERMLKTGIDRGRRKSAGPTSLTFPRERLEYGEVELEPPISTAKEKWVDLRNLLFEVGLSLLSTIHPIQLADTRT